MGTTIRREPVTTSIPAAPDYRFLNITNFGGIEKSSNPFVVESNTASDCLNVYVDEDNALSTRPRLQYQTDFIKDIINKFPALGLTGAFDLIGVYDLHDGYLIHGVENDIYYMFKYVDKNSIYQITGTEIPTEKCKIFEQSDVIYVLDGEKYRNIKNYVISEVEGYIPTTRVGKNKRIIDYLDDGSKIINYDTEGSSFESLNLLVDKYKESYFWDGVSEFKMSSAVIDVDNGYYLTNSTIRYLNVIKYYPDDTFLFKKLVNDKYKIIYGILNDDKKSYSEIDTGINVSPVEIDGKQYAVSIGTPLNSHAKTVAVLKPINNGSSTTQQDGSLTIYTLNSNTGDVEKRLSYSNLNTANIYVTPDEIDIGLSENGEYAWVNSSGYFTNNNQGALKYVPVSVDVSEYLPFKLYISDINKISYYFVAHETLDKFRLYITSNIDSADFEYTTIELINFKNMLAQLKFLPQGKGFYYNTLNGVSVYYYENSTSFTHKDVELINKKVLDFYVDSNLLYAYFTDSDDNVYFVQDYTEPEKNYKTLLKASGEIKYFKPGEILVHADYSQWFVQYYVESNEPLIVLTYSLEKDHPSFNDWSKISNIFDASKLSVRFDNNTWFTSNNYTFHTLYNDPTYIPLSGYNDLGESFEPITGLSIVNDNILAAYKRNRIYIITPITVGNELTYSYTETKNIIGNDVVDAPTLTILTEMPILVSHNGIYALNQLENVQSSDRITTLISEAMNPKWLKESQTDIDGCLVLNRLYWTYFILPHKKSTNGLIKDNNYTKVYLLDNRTGSWFYWELPIYVISAMVKNNKTHFVTEDGELFTLETTDIINKFNKDLTEYYDSLKKPTLIPWHWTSQILSLNTINYSKRLVDTTFVLTDTDMSDEYALNYKFKAFRKNKNAETTELTLTNDIEYVESITKRTMIPRFNFIQFTLSNTEDDEKLNNNKLRLVGLGLKYVLLGGLY